MKIADASVTGIMAQRYLDYLGFGNSLLWRNRALLILRPLFCML